MIGPQRFDLEHLDSQDVYKYIYIRVYAFRFRELRKAICIYVSLIDIKNFIYTSTCFFDGNGLEMGK